MRLGSGQALPPCCWEKSISRKMNFKDNYRNSEDGDIRCPIHAKDSFGGWAYVFIQAMDYVKDLAIHHPVQDG